jgi:ribosomal protein S18 acetylase RimI-like enzyme
MTLQPGEMLTQPSAQAKGPLPVSPSRRNRSLLTTVPTSATTASTIELVPASQFTLEELAAAYNQTRVDYIVPMPMNAVRLGEYIHNYDVDVELSIVAMEGEQILGLAMLGVRPGRTWITRLGVLPVKRRRGTGRLLMEYLIAQSARLQAPHIVLEVIKNNTPAHQLFLSLGFHEVRELLIVRRPPQALDGRSRAYTVETLNYHRAAELLQQRQSIPSWLDETPSLINAGNLRGLRVELDAGERGWLVYQHTVFQLGRLVLQTEAGDPHQVGLALLDALHRRHPILDTKSENLPANDPHWPAMKSLRYLESFRRIEMRLDLP